MAEGDVGTFAKAPMSWCLHSGFLTLQYGTWLETQNRGDCAEYAFLGFYFKYERRSPQAFGEDFEPFSFAWQMAVKGSGVRETAPSLCFSPRPMAIAIGRFLFLCNMLETGDL
ncbi:MAG: hypothetical protein IJS15_11020 [Victivallales bacterium]|nr:hypothetical protein [Victivallales bacterium]